MKSSIEILIHLKKFQNIDLFTQGIYQVRVSVPGAQPYILFDSIKTDPFTTNDVEQKFIFFEQNIEDQYFYSQGFLIRYEDEEIATNVGCVFRFQDNSPIEIVMELLFLDKKILGDLFVDNLAEVALNWKPTMSIVSKTTFQITNPLNYNKVFYPVEFDTSHFCLVQAQIHAIPTSFTFEKGYLQNAADDDFTNIDSSIEVLVECRDQLLKQIQKIQNEKKLVQFQFLKKQEYTKGSPEIEKRVQQNFHELHHDLYTLWVELIGLMKQHHQKVQDQLEQEYLFQMKERLMNCVISNKSEIKELGIASQNGKHNHELAKQRRSLLQQNEWKGIIYKELLTPLSAHPFLFKHACIKQDMFRSDYNQNVHYIVLVHGYQGSSYDMRYWKSMLTIRFKEKVHLLPASCNDQASNKPIEELGTQLANEVINYIYDDKSTDFRLSFIGHSLGGLIIRAALPQLKEFEKNMHTYISLASPHCGYASSESVLVDTGLMMIQKWNKCRTLEELSQKDHKDITNTYLYKLSTYEGLQWFNNVVLLSSFQDHYVPFNSALIQRIEDSNDPRVQAYNRVVTNILSKCNKIDRYDINFVITKKKLDKFIGRAAHIEFIDNLLLVKMFVYLYDEYFH